MRPPQLQKEPPHTSQLICRYFPGNVVLQTEPALEISYSKIDSNLKKDPFWQKDWGQYGVASVDKENLKWL